MVFNLNSNNSIPGEDLPVFVKWMDFLKWLLLTTDKFPKNVKFSFVQRIHDLALGAVEELVEARYTKNRIGINSLYHKG